MAKTVGIVIQNFEKIRQNNCFYIDKTDFICEWWERKDEVTLIARPHRFGKTLNMSMLEQFFLWIIRTGERCLKGFISGRMKRIKNCNALIRGLVCPL